jgi:NAD+ synthase (glutamine-hydrolysing)
MRIGLAQINSTLGDFSGNRKKILGFIRRARDHKCDLVVFPELSLMGYLPNDLLERPSIIDEQLKEFAKLQKDIPEGIGVVVGLITKSGLSKGKPYYNSAALMLKGKKPKFFNKELLPTYDVFDEARHIEKGKIADGFFTFKGVRFLMTICEDIWGWELPKHPTNYLENPLTKLCKNKIDCVLNISASPYTFTKQEDRLAVVKKTALNFKAPVVYVNLVGAQDEVVFDGGSIAVDAKGKVISQSLAFQEDLNLFDLESLKGLRREAKLEKFERTRQAIVLGMKDFAKKVGIERVHLGLSGGIDSAVVACLAVDAFGPGRVIGVAMPGPFNEKLSLDLAQKLAKKLDIRLIKMPIEKTYDVALESLKGSFGDFPFGLVNENLQARIRAMFLMALGNKENSLLLTTSNKAEMASGYSTLYGDMCGGLAPIADLVKSEVYELARLYNSERELIPEETISRAPSAELRPNQKDQDSLPPYDLLDASVKRIVERCEAAKTETDQWLLAQLMKSEFKRWQAPPVLKVSGHAFGRGRRMPIAHKARK